MAALTSAQISEMWRDGHCEQFSLFSIKNVNTGDTVDLGPFFRVVLQTTWMGGTVSGVANGTFNGVICTAPAGLTNAGAYLLVQGVAI